MKIWFVVPAAGSGRRLGGDIPKQYLALAGKRVVEHTLERLLTLAPAGAVVAVSAGDTLWPTLAISRHPLVRTAAGGAERADSVANALALLAGEAAGDDWVLVHDVARPCVRVADIELLIQRLENSPVGGILAAPVSDTLKRVSATRAIEGTEDRSRLWAAMTPQMFRYGLLTRALAAALDQGSKPTDEAMAVELLGYSPLVVEGHRDNIKITRREDLAIAETILHWQQRQRTTSGVAE